MRCFQIFYSDATSRVAINGFLGNAHKSNTIPEPHGEDSNYAFMDGHVKWIKKANALAPNAQNKTIKFYWLK